ncbi:MAG: N-acetyl-gamma-glutamyl-phosphate reductase [Lachnospiraceae bacterium]|nr:N-acetyl-gamma-glutamyl-phosphate reductase [Lachnospiraceae bacterium]
MKTKVFIDGSEGTTGLRIHERFALRDDVELLTIDPEKRKDPAERAKLINASDITFLCLPDVASVESVSLVENENVRIIDTSTAHRTNDAWAYGFPELNKEQREKIRCSKRIAVPGCYATGFISIAAPMVQSGLMSPDYPVSAFAVSGYSGAGKKAIAVYEGDEKPAEFDSPRQYALTQQHKHIPEMQKMSGLRRPPLFSPIVDDYYAGMFVSLPFYTDLLNDVKGPEKVHEMLMAHYEGEAFVKVMPLGAEAENNGFIAANTLAGYDGLELYVTGNEERIVVTSRFDNLGKGASGAAIQCMNILLGCAEDKGLRLQ